MSKPIVVITGPVPGTPQIAGAEIRTIEAAKPSAEELRRHVHGATAIISMYYHKMDAALFDAAGPQLKGVVNYAVGFDNIDLAVARTFASAQRLEHDGNRAAALNAYREILALDPGHVEARSAVARLAAPAAVTPKTSAEAAKTSHVRPTSAKKPGKAEPATPAATPVETTPTPTPPAQDDPFLSTKKPDDDPFLPVGGTP